MSHDETYTGDHGAIDPGTALATQPASATQTMPATMPAPRPRPTLPATRGGALLADFADFARAGSTLVESGLMPKGMTREQAAVVLAFGADLGFTATQSMRAVHVIEGKPSLSADALVALVLRSGLAQFVSTTESSDERVTVATQRVGSPVVETATWDAARARKASLASKPNHQKHPAQMLYARAAAELMRRVYPDVAHGIYVDSEIFDGEASALRPSSPASSPRPALAALAATVRASLPAAQPSPVATASDPPPAPAETTAPEPDDLDLDPTKPL